MIVAIVVNGDPMDGRFLKAELAKADYIIAADGGMYHLDAIAVTPNVLVGDLDSYDVDARILPEGLDVIQLPCEKDLSDLEFAVQLALDRGATEIRLFNALGDRLDHTLTNLNVLMQIAVRGVKAALIDEKQRLFCAQTIQHLDGIAGQTFSILPLTDLAGVSIKGAKYPLDNHNVKHYSSLCLSNVAIDERVTIVIESGDAFIVVND